jgi:sigma-B regulation protein RsbU (phosphoserine phosphatase)
MELSAETKYRLLLEITQKLRDTFDLDEILNLILETLQKYLVCDAAGIFILNRDLPAMQYGFSGHLIAGVAQFGFPSEPSAGDPMLSEGKGIIGRVIYTGECMVVQDVRQNPYYISGRPGTQSEIAVPVILNDRVIGAVNVESDQLSAFNESDLELLQLFANAAALSIEKAVLHRQIVEKELLEKQLDTACDVQERLLPKGSPGVPGYEITGLCIPTEEVGGDYFDYIHLPHNRFGIAVGDVSGHGIPAALVMTAFRALLRTHAHSRTKPARIASVINRDLPEFTADQHFVTAFYASLDPPTGQLEYVSCGHPPPLLVHPDGLVQKLERRGPALGILPEPEYRTGEVTLDPGDIMIAYTDGVTEIEDNQGRRFGSDGLAVMVHELRSLPVEALAEKIVSTTKRYAGTHGYRDDFTLVLLRRSL